MAGPTDLGGSQQFPLSRQLLGARCSHPYPQDSPSVYRLDRSADCLSHSQRRVRLVLLALGCPSHAWLTRIQRRLTFKGI